MRNRGTIGGSVANNDPAADYPAALLALGATIGTNKREIKADDFFKGLFATALAGRRDHHPHLASRSRQVRLREVPEPGLALRPRRRRRGADGHRQARVAVTGAGKNGVFRQQAAEAALAKSWSAQALAASPPMPTR